LNCAAYALASAAVEADVTPKRTVTSAPDALSFEINLHLLQEVPVSLMHKECMYRM
jgi:hypothetical protein